MIHLAVLALALAGFALLLLAMIRHQQDWLGRRLGAGLSRSLRLSGFLSLALAFALAGANLGWAYGAVTWFGWLTVASAMTVAANVNRASITRFTRRLRP